MNKPLISLVVLLSMLASGASTAYADAPTQTQQSQQQVTYTQQADSSVYLNQMRSYYEGLRVDPLKQAEFKAAAIKYFKAEGRGVPSDWALSSVGGSVVRNIIPKELQSNYQQATTREEAAILFVSFVMDDFNLFIRDIDEGAKNAWLQKKIDVDFFNKQVTKTDFKGFSDTKSPYVEAAVKLGIMKGISADKFNPNGKLTREEWAVMLHNYVQMQIPSQLYSDEYVISDASSWAKESIASVTYSSIMFGTKLPEYSKKDPSKVSIKGNFNPKGTLTREQTIVSLTSLTFNTLSGSTLYIDGFMSIDMDMLCLGIEMNDKEIKLLNSSYDNMCYFQNDRYMAYGGELDYENKYWADGSSKPAIMTFFGDSIDLKDYGKDMLEKKSIVFNTGAFKTEYNPKDSRYLAIVTKNGWKNHLALSGGRHYYYDKVTGEKTKLEWGVRVK